MGIHIITFATHSSGKFEKLKDDLKKNNIELNVIGWGTKWECYLKKLENTISNYFNKDDTILYSSCFDANTGFFETFLGP